MNKIKFGVISSVSTLVLALSAAAQSGPDSGADAAETETRTLGAITVTAEKRAANLQDVPISISAFTGETLEDLGITETDQLGEFLPGLEILSPSGEGSQVVFFLRGAGLNDFNTNNAGPVAVYADEVYVSSPVLTAFQFFDTERLEVLKGPQGTLYGRNTTGGAIKFISNKPTDTFEASLRASYSSFNTTELEAAISGPLSDNVRARVAAVKKDSDGFGTNLVTGEDTHGFDTLAWRAFIDVDATDRLALRFNLHGAQNESQASQFNHFGLLSVDGAGNVTGSGTQDVLGYPGTGDAYDGEYNRVGDVDQDSIGGYFQATYDFDGFDFTSITAYDEVEHFLPEDSDASPLSLLFVSYGVESETFTQEFRLAGNTDRGNWLLGAYYLNEDLDQVNGLELFTELLPLTGGVGDLSGALVGAPVVISETVNKQSTETYALFGQGTYDLTDQLSATVGLRYTSEDRDFDGASNILNDQYFVGFDESSNPIIVDGPLPLYSVPGLSTSDDAISWRVALDYKPNEDTLLYGSVSRGFKSGGFNGGLLSGDPATAVAELQPYEPEFITAYEVGFKSELFNKALRLNGALFLNDFEDLQVFTLINTGNLPVQVLDNAGGAEVFGFELDATAFPTDNLVLNLSLALYDSELEDTSGTGGFDGNSIANTPDTSISGLARYEFDAFNGGRFHVQGSAAYKSDIFFSTENNPLVAQDGYTLLNAQLGYTSADGRFEFNLFGKNLGDEEYLVNAADLSDFGLIQRMFAAPRSFGAELRVSF
ncbi:TonB-dependent receptor [Henriciella litoralis]|uniref:TonB-dependent receptor n=1 Tax=Henriciella litoralis TaxID=568102 RepID=UPI00146F6799|nr:TonB-dependent receptor [Henriciella litoralis]